MKVAHIVPPGWTGIFQQENYRMVLAHWAQDDENYVKNIRRRPKALDHSNTYLILDNGSFEESQLSVSELNEAAFRVNADEVVLPDVLGESKETLQLSWDALGKVSTKRVMFVPQGRTFEGWKECLRAWIYKWKRSPWCDDYSLAIGISSLRTKEGTKPQVGSKASLIPEAAFYGYPLHLLGVASPVEFVRNELQEAKAFGVRGVDTSTAFALGAKRFLLTPSSVKVSLGNPSQYKTLVTGARRLIHLNTAILSAWVQTDCDPKTIPTYLIRQTASKWLKYYAEGFVSINVAMKACYMPRGKYALLKRHNKEISIRPLTRSDKLKAREILVEVKCER